MPKSADVEDFAAKLALLVKRLNWSRAKLAQQVGVHKSLAARWLNGSSRPTGNSLMQLTTAVAQAIEGFNAADWDLTPEHLARRLGIGPRCTPPRLAGLRRHGSRCRVCATPAGRHVGRGLCGLWAGFYRA